MPASHQKTVTSLHLKRNQTLIYFASFIALGFFTSVLGPSLPRLAEHTGATVSAISSLFLARSVGYLLGSLYSGQAFDRLPGHILLAGVLLLAAGTAALIPVVSLLWVLALVFFILGSVEGSLDVGGNLLLVWVHRKNPDPYLNALHFFFGVGAFLIPIIIAQSILIGGDIHWAYWIIAIYPIPLAIWSLRVPGPVAVDESQVDEQVETNTLFVGLMATLFFLYVGAEVSYGGWIFTYSTTLVLGDEASAAYLTSAFWGALTFGRLIAIPVAMRVRPRYILYVDLLGCLVSISLIILFPHSYIAIWVGTIGLGLSMASFFPTALAYASNRMVTRGSITRWFFVGAGVGGMVLPWLIGQLFESLGPPVVMVAILVNLVITFIVFSLSNRFDRISLTND